MLVYRHLFLFIDSSKMSQSIFCHHCTTATSNSSDEQNNQKHFIKQKYMEIAWINTDDMGLAKSMGMQAWRSPAQQGKSLSVFY